MSAHPTVDSISADGIRSFFCTQCHLDQPSPLVYNASGFPHQSHLNIPVTTNYQLLPPTVASKSLSLSLSSDPIPAKVVHSIQSGQYVEMRDLLGDNMALKSQPTPRVPPCVFPPTCSAGCHKAPSPGGHYSPSMDPLFPGILGSANYRPPDPRPTSLCQTDCRRGITSWWARMVGIRSFVPAPGCFRLVFGLECDPCWPASNQYPWPAFRNRHFCNLCRGCDHQANQCAMSYTQTSNLSEITLNHMGITQGRYAPYPLSLVYRLHLCTNPLR